jgi:nitrate reductase gamma subunit
MLFFIGQVFPYIAAGVFIVGMAWRIGTWLKAPVPFQLTLFPAPSSTVGRVAAVGEELLMFTSLRRGDKGLWLWAWLMHVSLAMIIVGHIVGIYFLTHQFTMIGLSPAESSRLSALLGLIAGGVFFVSLLVLFYRRTAIPEVKRLSDPADYFDIMLLLAIVVSGMHMRVTSIEVDLPAIRTYLGALLAFRPIPIPHEWVFVSHYFLVNVLLLYFPFSNLVHLAGFIVNRAILVEAPPVYPTPSGVSRDLRIGKRGEAQ